MVQTFSRSRFEPVRQGLFCIDDDKRIDAAAGSRAGKADQPTGRVFAEIHREMRDDQKMEGLRDLAGLCVVLGQRFILIAQVLLQHVLHVYGEVRQALVDLRRLGPDAVIDEPVIVVRQVHEGREVFAATDGVDDRAANLARRHRGPRAQEQALQCIDGGRLPGVVSAK